MLNRTARLSAGPNALEWRPLHATPGTYAVRLELVDAAGNRRTYDVRQKDGKRSSDTPIVRVLGIDASFTRESAAPGGIAWLEIATDAPALRLQILRSGPEKGPTYRDDVMNGIPVTIPEVIAWRAHRDRPARTAIRIGNWPTGVYYAQVSALDGRVGYAPLIIRPRQLGEHRVAVVLPTYTWQAYNFWDENSDGFGDTWYAKCARCSVTLGRPYLNRGQPPHFRRYDLPFLRWLSQRGRRVDYLTDSDLEAVSAAQLATAYDLVTFPGHHEYVTRHEYDLVRRYRNLGGNLVFLAANNFFWRVDRQGDVLERKDQWRRLGRPEAELIGVQYRGNDDGTRKGPFVVRDTAAAPWFFRGTGLTNGSTFTGYGSASGRFGVEIDAVAASSPAGTKILAEIPNLYGNGVTAHMTYYETSNGAKVFAAGAFTLAGAASWQPVTRLLDNLWTKLAKP